MRSIYDESAFEVEKTLSPELELKWSRLVKKYIGGEAFPGCVIYVAKDGNTLFHRSFGRYTYEPDSVPVSLDTIYDLASVTKAAVTIPMVMKLWEQKKLRLDMRVIDFFPEFKDGEKPKITIQHLITHMSGLPGWTAFYETCSSLAEVIRAILATPLKYPVGTQTEYSDLGIILMGEIIQKIYGAALDAASHREIHKPLGMRDTFYRPLHEICHRIAPTEIDPWRGRLLQGEVSDRNTFVMGGVSGHAGLFSTASDLARYCQCILNGGVLGGIRIFEEETIEFFSHRPSSLSPGPYALGWHIPPYQRGDNPIFTPGSIGHLGFTGTCIWMDRSRQTQIVFLSNRVYPDRTHKKVTEFRTEFVDLVFASLFPFD